jgi:hypothetical protein
MKSVKTAVKNLVIFSRSYNLVEVWEIFDWEMFKQLIV